MAIEIEIKVALTRVELEDLQSRLKTLESRLVSPAAEEINRLFDFADRRLQQSQSAIRLRSYGDQSLLTYKGPTQPDPLFKRRAEFETTVADPAALLEIFDALGLQQTFEYRKQREIHQLRLDEHWLELAIDRTPLGFFAELEGDPELLEEAAGLLNWSPRKFIRKSYVQLYSEAGLGFPCEG